MTWSKLSKTTRFLLSAIVLVLGLGAYAVLRFSAEYKVISNNKNQIETMQKKLQTSYIPEEPDQDLQDILEQLEAQEAEMAQSVAEWEALQARMAPAQSQSLKVQISGLARQSRVRFRINEVFKVSPLVIVKPRIRTKAQRSKNKQVLPLVDYILPASRPWVERLAPRSVFQRPMQRIELEGSFSALRAFVQGLDDLDWQVTVIRMKIDKLPIAPLKGYPQLLTAELILAL